MRHGRGRLPLTLRLAFAVGLAVAARLAAIVGLALAVRFPLGTCLVFTAPPGCLDAGWVCSCEDAAAWRAGKQSHEDR